MGRGMRHVPKEDINNKLMESSGYSSAYYWGRGEFRVYGPDSFYPSGVTDRATLFECLGCREHFHFEGCENCGNSIVPGFTMLSRGLVCKRCEHPFFTWVCPKCDCNNPVMKTLYVPKLRDNGTSKKSTSGGMALSQLLSMDNMIVRK